MIKRLKSVKIGCFPLLVVRASHTDCFPRHSRVRIWLGHLPDWRPTGNMIRELVSRMTVSETKSTITHSKQVSFLIAFTLNWGALQQNVCVTKRVNKNSDIMKCRAFAWYGVHFRRHSRFFPVVRKYGCCQRQPSRRTNKPTYLESRGRRAFSSPFCNAPKITLRRTILRRFSKGFH